MRVTISRLLRSGFILAAVFGCLQTCSAQEWATALLKKVLKSQRSVDYLHIESRSYGTGKATAQVKVQTLVGKGVMVTILQPSDRSGIVTIDDAKESKTYFPDQEQVLVQPSPFLLQPTFELRWALINENYEVKTGRSDRIADQAVREIVLQPLDEEVPIRRMFIDPKHSVVLRYAVDTDGSNQKVLFDTKYVVFDREAAETDFGLPGEAESAKVVKVSGPQRLLTPEGSRPAMEFTTRMPSDLPFGFKISGAYLFGKGKGQYVAVKITDGLATLTVYQWKKSRSYTPVDARLTVVDKYNVSIGIGVVPGDFMPDSVLKRILEAFKDNLE